MYFSFFLMIRRPPRSTLFPYTTLFRSFFTGMSVLKDAFQINIEPLLASAGIAGLAIGFGAQTLVKDVINGFFIDRKSTRLNSSHTVISYAVFCLKQKREILLSNQADQE